MTQTLVTIYSPSGKKENHTTQNALDLVRSCGYTFKPGKTYLPTESVPFAKVDAAKLPSAAQEALDSVGTGSEIGAAENAHVGQGASYITVSEAAPEGWAPPAPDIADEADAGEDAPAEKVMEQAQESETAPAPAPAAPAPKPRQQRAKKGA